MSRSLDIWMPPNARSLFPSPSLSLCLSRTHERARTHTLCLPRVHTHAHTHSLFVFLFLFFSLCEREWFSFLSVWVNGNVFVFFPDSVAVVRVCAEHVFIAVCTPAPLSLFQIKALDTGGGVRGCSAWFGYVAKEHYSPSGNPSQCAKTQPWHSMSETDIFGCGLDLASRRVHFFKNGEPSGGTSSLPVGPTEVCFFQSLLLRQKYPCRSSRAPPPVQFYPFIAHFTRAIAFQTHEVESVPEILRS